MLVKLEKIDRPGRIDRLEIEQAEVEELAKSMEQQGLLEPVILREKQGRYEIVAGDRRCLAARLLGWKEIEAIVKDLSDEETAEIRATENLQRVNLTPIEEGKVYENLHRFHGYTIEQIARKVGINASLVKRRLDLLKMPLFLQEAIQKNLITYGVAEALWTIQDENAMRYYLGFAVDHGATVAVAREWAKDWKEQNRRNEQQDKDPMEIENPLMQEGTCRPTYLACDICDAPVEAAKIKIIRICPGCLKRIIAAKQAE